MLGNYPMAARSVASRVALSATELVSGAYSEVKKCSFVALVDSPLNIN
jgi:hypothetical protein